MCSFPTILGIIIGVTTVITPIGPVNGYMGSAVENFADMGVNQTNVSVTNLISRSLDVDEMYVFYEDNADLFAQPSPSVGLSTTVEYGMDEMDPISVGGYSEQYLDLREYTMETGRDISYANIMSRQKVCIIGASMTQELHGSTQSALDQTIKIGGYSFKTVGVMTQKEDNMDDGGTDDFIWLPYSVAVKVSRNTIISSYTSTSMNTGLSDGCVTAIEDPLYETFKDDDLYRVTAMNEMLGSLNGQVIMTSATLGGTAGTSLLVAGVGVMNIMLVSVTERTRKIGIRKPLGADKGTIMRQLVTEAVITSSLEGVVRILIGCISTTLVGAAIGITTMPTSVAITTSFSMSVGIGPLSGYTPASRAANLNPIGALRNE